MTINLKEKLKQADQVADNSHFDNNLNKEKDKNTEDLLKEQYHKNKLKEKEHNKKVRSYRTIDNVFDFYEGKFLTFWNKYNQLMQASIELIDWQNLPKGLDKYNLEYIIKTNGLVGIINIDDRYIPTQVMPIGYDRKSTFEKFSRLNNNQDMVWSTSMNIGDKPALVQVVQQTQPILKPFMGKNLIVDEDIYVIRNDLFMKADLIKIGRYLNGYCKILDILAENNIKALPKMGYLDGKASFNTEEELNKWVNSIKTFKVISLPTDVISQLNTNPSASPFKPVQFEDMREMIYAAFTFYDNRLKETLGFDTTEANGKKERMLGNEIKVNSTISTYNIEHFVNIRKNDIEPLNKDFGLNITVEKKEIENSLEKGMLDRESTARDKEDNQK